MVKPKQLGHLVLRVRDIDRSEEFYNDVLGLHTTTKRPGAMVFLSAGDDASHELALMSVGPDAPGPEKDRVGLYHFAWEMESFEDLKELYQRLKETHIRITGFGDHGVSLGVYLRDPDDNEIEVFYELPKSHWPNGEGVFGGKFPWKLEEEPAGVGDN